MPGVRPTATGSVRSLGLAVRFGMVSATRGGELGADLPGLGGAEFGVEAERVLPVVACLAQVAGGVMGASEAIVGAGLLGLVADLASQTERRDVLGTGIFGLANGEEHLSQAIKRLGFTGLATDLAGQG